MTVSVEAYLSPGHISGRENTWHRYGGEFGAVVDRLAGLLQGLIWRERNGLLMAWSPQ